MIPRIYTSVELKRDSCFDLDPQQTHYLVNVLRLKDEGLIRVFNERDGEWKGVVKINKKQLLVKNLQFFCKAKLCNPLWLAFALIKHDPLDFLLEKATELGVTHLQPIITERCNIKNINVERWHKNITQAAQQSERHDIPEILSIQTLDDLLKNDVDWFACIERQNYALPILNALQKIIPNITYGFIVGPEGGLSAREQDLLSSSNVTCVSLGQRILRAETAAINALSCYQAIMLNINLVNITQ